MFENFEDYLKRTVYEITLNDAGYHVPAIHEVSGTVATILEKYVQQSYSRYRPIIRRTSTGILSVIDRDNDCVKFIVDEPEYKDIRATFGEDIKGVDADKKALDFTIDDRSGYSLGTMLGDYNLDVE